MGTRRFDVFAAMRAVVRPDDPAFLEGLTSTERLVLLALVSRADTRGRCFPSLNTLARATSLDRRTVTRTLAALEAAQLIERRRRAEGRRVQSTVYTLRLGRGTMPLGAEDPQGHHAPGVGAQNPQGRGTVPPEVSTEVPTEEETPFGGADAPGSASRAQKGGAATDRRPSWLTPYAEAWAAEMGGAPPYGRIGAALRPLRAHHDEADILAVWRWYLRTRREAGRAAYASPQDFAARFGAYRDEMRGAAAPAKAGGAMSARRYAETIDWTRYETEDDV